MTNSLNWRKKGVHAFPNCISPNVDVIKWLELKLAYYEDEKKIGIWAQVKKSYLTVVILAKVRILSL